MNKDINKTHRSALFYLYNINYYLTSESAAALLHTFVTSHVDYCNSLYYASQVVVHSNNNSNSQCFVGPHRISKIEITSVKMKQKLLFYSMCTNLSALSSHLHSL